MMFDIEDYTSSYTPITRLVPMDLLDLIFEHGRVFQETSICEYRLRGEPHFKYQWHVSLDVMLTYQHGEDMDGEFAPYDTPEVKAVLWPKSPNDLVDDLPYIEPVVVIHINGEWGDGDRQFAAWVKDDYLRTPEGSKLNAYLMKAKLKLRPDLEEDVA